MSAVNDLHHQAMEYADAALREQRARNADNAAGLFAQAAECELAAIAAMEEPVEPTYSVLHRSAASMAMNARRYRWAEQIAAKALAQEPHPEIAEEMRDLLEQIYFNQRLERNTLSLAGNSIELSIAGPAVGLGLASPKEVFRRVEYAIKLFIRTAERKRGLEFRGAGQPQKSIREHFQPFISVPHSGSFAIGLQFGSSPGQLTLPGITDAEEVAAEFMLSLEMVENASDAQLREHIPDPEYLSNFLSVARKLAPDGERIRRVGLGCATGGAHRYVVITKPASKIPLPPAPEMTVPYWEPEPVEIQGTLLFADATDPEQHGIKIVDSDRRLHTIQVPVGMLDDIVRPMWHTPVKIRGIRTENPSVIVLQEIFEADDDFL